MKKYYIIYYFGSGYYVGWRTKMEDEYSELTINANKYKTINSLVFNRLNIKNRFSPLDDFTKRMENSDFMYQRILKISKIKKIEFKPCFSDDIWNKLGYRIDIVETDEQDSFKVTTMNPILLYKELCIKKDKCFKTIPTDKPLNVRIDKLDENDSFWG